MKVKDLKNQIGSPHPRPFLFCFQCGQQSSANLGDYFFLPDGHEFVCCEEAMVLATESRIISVLEKE